jgi:hypothetical protein
MIVCEATLGVMKGALNKMYYYYYLLLYHYHSNHYLAFYAVLRR